MSSPQREPDLKVLLELTAMALDGTPKTVTSGYRPTYDIRPDYRTSSFHEFIDCDRVRTGESANAHIWLLTPEVYPHTLCVGRQLAVSEGSRIVGKATILQIYNSILRSESAAPASQR